MIKFVFPYCVISDFGPTKTISGSISITSLGSTVTKTFELKSTAWDKQVAADEIEFEFEDKILVDAEVALEFTANTGHPHYLVLLMAPKLVKEQALNATIMVEMQKVGTEFENTDGVWTNMPIKDKQTGRAVLRTYAHDSSNSLPGFLTKKIKFHETLTYTQREQSKPQLSIEDNIEYYLGKDKVKNLAFESTIPGAWDIPARPIHEHTMIHVNTKRWGFCKGDTIMYHYNNLGYRANFDFTPELLKSKPVVVCLGDSDAFGVGVELEDIWSSKLQTLMGDDVIVLNMSVPGLSNDGLARLGSRVITALQSNIRAVCIHYAPLSLRELASKTYQGGVHTHRNYHLPYDDWWKHIDWHSNNYNFHKNRLLLDGLCGKYNIQFEDLYINNEDPKVPFDYLEYSVYKSIGPRGHTALANYFYKKITGQPSLFESTQS